MAKEAPAGRLCWRTGRWTNGAGETETRDEREGRDERGETREERRAMGDEQWRPRSAVQNCERGFVEFFTNPSEPLGRNTGREANAKLEGNQDGQMMHTDTHTHTATRVGNVTNGLLVTTPAKCLRLIDNLPCDRCWSQKKRVAEAMRAPPLAIAVRTVHRLTHMHMVYLDACPRLAPCLRNAQYRPT